MGQCPEIDALIQQGTIIRNAYGKLCWPDGSLIYRNRDESLVQAVNKAIKRSNIISMERKPESEDEDDEEYETIEIDRHDSDASSDEQGDLGWSSKSVMGSYALGAERNPGVSKAMQRPVQNHVPSKAQGMKVLPKNRNTVRLDRQGPPIRNGMDPHSKQSGTPKRLTPFDVDQFKLERIHDSQFIPMDIDQGVPEKSGNNKGQITTNQGRSNVTKPPNPGPEEDKISTQIAQRIMGKEITIRLDEIAQIAPSVRQDLQRVLRELRVVSRPTQEKKEKTEKTVLWSSTVEPLPQNLEKGKFDVRDDLPTVSARVGQATMMAIVDSGSQVNVMSEKYMRRCCLPVRTDNTHQYRITGIDGGPAMCIGIIPKATIFITEREIPTVGEIVVVKDAIFDLILGRPWTTGNGANLIEEPDGTYLELRNGEEHYSINVCPNFEFEKRQRQRELEEERIERSRGSQARAAVVSKGTLRPESQTEISSPRGKVSLFGSVQQQEQILDWPPDSEESSDGESDEQSDDEDRGRAEQWFGSAQDRERERQLSPPSPNPNISNPDPHNDYSMEIETNLQESYIKLVQKGANEEEWEKFREAENQRLKEKKNQWKQWKEEAEKTSVPDDARDRDLEDLPEDSPEPPNALTTPEPTPRGSRKPRKAPRPQERSAVTSLRRSQRIRRESRRAQESEYWQNLKNRNYEREDRLTKKTIKTRNRDAIRRAAVCLGVKRTKGKLREQERASDEAEEEGGNSAYPNRTLDFLDWPNDASCSTDRKQSRKGYHYESGEETESEECYEETDHRLYPTPDRDSRPRKPRIKGKWIVSPDCLPRKDGNPERDHQVQMSRDEVHTLYNWITKWKCTRELYFFTHKIRGDGVAVTIIPRKERFEEPETVLEAARVMELWRNASGTLTAVPKHRIQCAVRALKRKSLRCTCKREGPMDVPRFRSPEPGTEIYEMLGLGRTTEDLGGSDLPNPEIPKKETVRATAGERNDAAATRNLTESGNKRLEATRTGTKLAKPSIGKPKHTVTTRSSDRSSTKETRDDKPPDPDDGVTDRQTRQGNETYPEKVEPRIQVTNPEDGHPGRATDDKSRQLIEDPRMDLRLTREELVEITEWCEALPGHRKKGIIFELSQTNRRTITLTRMDDASTSANSQRVRTLILEIERAPTGQLRKVAGTNLGPHGRNLETIRNISEGTKDKVDVRQGDDSIVRVQNEFKNTRAMTRSPQERFLRSLVMTKVPERQTEYRPDESASVDNEDMETTDLPEYEDVIPRTPPLKIEGTNLLDSRIAWEMGQYFPKPRIVQNLPIPFRAAPGLIGARRLTRIVQYDRQEDHEFFAKGVTITLEEEGQVRHYRGNAMIRVSRRDLWPRPKPPRRRHMDAYRRQLFSMDQGSETSDDQEEGDVHDDYEVPVTRANVTDARGVGQRNKTIQRTRHWREGMTRKELDRTVDEWRRGMTRAELDAVIQELETGPVDEERAYQIVKDRRGVVKIARLPLESGIVIRELDTEDEEVSSEDEDENDGRPGSPRTHTRLGNDPHPSDGEISAQGQKANLDNSDLRQAPNGSTEALEAMQEWVFADDPQEENEILQDDKSIKLARGDSQGEEPTHLLSISPLLLELNPSKPSTCNQQMNQQPPPQPPPQRQLRSMATLNAVARGEHVPVTLATSNVQRSEDDSLDLPHCPTRYQPGVLAATHLASIPFPDSTPEEPTFFGYGATLTIEGPGGTLETRQGHCLIHWYKVVPLEVNAPPPPSPRRVEHLRMLIFRDSRVPRRPPGIRPDEDTCPEEVLAQFRLDQERARVSRETDQRFRTSEGKDEVSQPTPEDREGAEVLLSVREAARHKGSPGKPSVPPSFASVASNTSVAGATPRQIQFVSAGYLPGTISDGDPVKQANQPVVQGPANARTSVNPFKAEGYKAAPTEVNSQANPSEPPDISMGSADHDRDHLKSPPPLLYPDTEDDNDDAVLVPKQLTSMGHGDPTRTSDISTLRISGVQEGRPTTRDGRKSTPLGYEALYDLQGWQTTMSTLTKMMKEGSSWSSDNVREVFEELELLQWWYAISGEEEANRKLDWPRWKERVVQQWSIRCPKIPVGTFRQMVEDLEQLDKATRPMRVLAMKIRKGRKDAKEDVEMTDEDVPRRESTPLPAYSPLSPPYTPASPQLKPITDAERKANIEDGYNFFRDWSAALRVIEGNLMETGSWATEKIKKIFESLGLQEWWKKLEQGERDEETKDWSELKRLAAATGIARYPYIGSKYFYRMMEEIERLDKKKPRNKNPANEISRKPNDDIDMEEEDEPRAPNPTPINSSSPAPEEDIDVDPPKAALPAVFDAEEFELVRTKVFELEVRVTEAVADLRRKISSLGTEVFEDGVMLTKLRWRVAELGVDEAKAKAGPGKRAYRKAKERPIGHRYPTRYAEAIVEEAIEVSRKEFVELEKKGKVYEERVKALEEEIAQVKTDLAKAEALGPKVELLAAAFEKFRASQVNINLSLVSQHARLRNDHASTIEPMIAKHNRDIANLNNRYYALYSMTANLMGKQQATNLETATRVLTPMQQHLVSRTSFVPSPNAPVFIPNNTIAIPPARQAMAM